MRLQKLLAFVAILSVLAFAATPAQAICPYSGDKSSPASSLNDICKPYFSAVSITVGTPVTAGRAISINVSVAGNVALTLSDSSVLVITLPVGYYIMPFSVIQVNTSGTTATAVYRNLP